MHKSMQIGKIYIQVVMNKKNLISIHLIVIVTLSIIAGSCKTNLNPKPVLTKTTPDSIILEVCDSITKQWSFDSKQVFIKNIQSKDSIRKDFYWDPDSGNSINYQKVEYAYDDKGNETSQIYQTFDNKTSQWILSSKTEATYNNQRNRILETFYTWQTSSSHWVASVKTEFFYDGNGNDTLETLYIWNTNANKWIVSCKVENSYNAKGNKILRVDYKWVEGSNKWEFLCKYEYTYDEPNNLKSQKYYYWFSVSKVWANFSISEYQYNHQLISHDYHHQWLFSSNRWFLDNRRTYYYRKRR
jgi:hypothetical protein